MLNFSLSVIVSVLTVRLTGPLRTILAKTVWKFTCWAPLWASLWPPSPCALDISEGT